MPAARPRMLVTPSEKTYQLLKEIQRLTGKRPATIARELLDEAEPALQITVEAFRLVEKRPEKAEAALNQFAMKAISQLSQAQLDLNKAMEAKRGRKPKGAASG